MQMRTEWMFQGPGHKVKFTLHPAKTGVLRNRAASRKCIIYVSVALNTQICTVYYFWSTPLMPYKVLLFFSFNPKTYAFCLLLWTCLGSVLVIRCHLSRAPPIPHLPYEDKDLTSNSAPEPVLRSVGNHPLMVVWLGNSTCTPPLGVVC